MIETRIWNAIDHLDTPEAIAAYLRAAMEDGDPRLIDAALADIARALGVGDGLAHSLNDLVNHGAGPRD